jgi:conjugal transfer pilus assembly protein TraF
MVKPMAKFILIVLLFLLLNLSLESYCFGDEKPYYGSPGTVWNLPNKESDEEAGDPNEQMTAVQTTVKTLLNKAVLSPTKNNVKNYIEVQNAVSANASKFSHIWQSVLMENPELDYTLIHPTNNTAIQVEYDETTQQENNVIKQLAKQSGLVFFYRSSCPYCRKFAPVLKSFADKYGVTVLPVTTDGIALPEFPQSYIDHGQAKRFHATVEPAVFAVNPYTHKAIPVSYGLVSETELKNRIMKIATHFYGDVNP